jgi:hypothetical protein
VKTEREDENEQNDDISDRTEGYTTTKTDKVDEHGHDKAKTYEPKTDKVDEHGHDKANKCEPTTTTQVKLKLLKNKAMQMMTMNKIK